MRKSGYLFLPPTSELTPISFSLAPYQFWRWYSLSFLETRRISDPWRIASTHWVNTTRGVMETLRLGRGNRASGRSLEGTVSPDQGNQTRRAGRPRSDDETESRAGIAASG